MSKGGGQCPYCKKTVGQALRTDTFNGVKVDTFQCMPCTTKFAIKREVTIADGIDAMIADLRQRVEVFRM